MDRVAEPADPTMAEHRQLKPIKSFTHLDKCI
jgi:hypothetical protein